MKNLFHFNFLRLEEEIVIRSVVSPHSPHFTCCWTEHILLLQQLCNRILRT